MVVDYAKISANWYGVIVFASKNIFVGIYTIILNYSIFFIRPDLGKCLRQKSFIA